MFGFQNKPQILEILDKLKEKQLADGGVSVFASDPQAEI